MDLTRAKLLTNPEAICEGLLAGSGHAFLAWLVEYLQGALGVSYVLVGELWGEDWDRVRTLALQTPSGAGENFSYDLGGTPCEQVLTQSACAIAKGVAQGFPEDLLLVEMGIESYVGLPLSDFSGRPLGVFVVLHTEELDSGRAELASDMLKSFSGRVEAELTRRRVERELESVVESSAKATTDDSLDSIVLALAHALHVKIAFVATPVEDDPTKIRTLALCLDGTLQEDLIYPVAGTPCEGIYASAFIFHGSGVQELYPTDTFLKKVGAEAYVAQAFRSASGHPLGHVGIVHDRPLRDELCRQPLFGIFTGRVATELKRAHAQRKRIALERTLFERQRIESLGVLAGGVAHDLNNMMAVVIGNAELLSLALKEPEFADQCTSIVEAGSRASALCKSMLAYAGRGALGIEAVDLNELAREAHGFLRAIIPKRIEVLLETCPTKLVLEADRSQLRQVLMNLVLNASEAIGDDRGSIRIELGGCQFAGDEPSLARGSLTLAAGECAELRVSDTGCGMSPALLERIFDPFFTTNLPGRGLGLAAVQGIVRSSGGALAVESTPGVGTRFRVRLPLSHALVKEAPSVEGPVESMGCVLVVDDEPEILATTGSLLAWHGLTPLTAGSGREAIELFRARSTSVDCVLLDFSMPGLDGGETAVELRKIRADVPIVLCTGFAEQEFVDRFKHLALDGVLHKPFSASELIDRVNQATQRSASRKKPSSEA